MTVAKMLTCRREGCIALATVTVHGSGHPTRPNTGKTPYCDAHWEEAYETVRDYPTHGWTAVEQSADTLF
jgi:hypothetical protein